MKSAKQHINDQSYPGHFIHPAEDQEIIQGDDLMTTGFWKKLPVYIRESETEISVDVTLPGLKREDFVVTASEGIVTISDIRKPASGRPAFKTSSFNDHPPACFFRQISLPESADTEFVSAEYADGVLHLVIAKLQSPAQRGYCKIAVY